VLLTVSKKPSSLVPQQGADRNDDDDGDEANHDAVFNGGCALFVADAVS
jgi:hypothetical protein